jgi:ABC-type molybdate transport system permease subunit
MNSVERKHNPLRVLLIEDSEDDAALVLRELHRGGYDVNCRRVETAHEALLAIGHPPATSRHVRGGIGTPVLLFHPKLVRVAIEQKRLPLVPYPRRAVLYTLVLSALVILSAYNVRDGLSGRFSLSLMSTLIFTIFNLSLVVWMMRGFFQEIPKEIEEAALLDGETRMGALLRIVLPLVRPGLAATAVFCLIVAWNEFLFALILTQTESAMTLPVGIAARVTQYEIKWGAMSAAGVVAMLPVLIFATAVQKHLVRGLSLGAVKG